MQGSKGGIYKRYLKRPIDFILSLLSIVVLSPLFLFVACLIKTKLGSPVLFKQERPGLNEEVFMMYKFRTMTNEKDRNGEYLPDDVRLTRFGKFLRSTSLDELPGLFNILKGDMSIIGPRPLLVQYLPLYNDQQKRRHEVRPGLSGLAQISGRNTISWNDKFQLDVEYIDNISFFLDWKIIFLTIKKVFIREGINSETAATIEPFQGTEASNKDKNKLLIIGAGGHGRVIANIAMDMKKWDSVEFLDNDKSIKTYMGLKVIGTTDDLSKYLDEYEVFVGIGDNVLRKRIYAELESLGASIPILIHPKAIIGEQVKVGLGSVIMAGVIINCNTSIGRGCIINTGSTVDHDNVIKDFVHISPGVHLAGTVSVGQGSWLGIGSVVNNNVNIIDNTKIGAGGVVIKNVIASGIYVGVPVRRIK